MPFPIPTAPPSIAAPADVVDRSPFRHTWQADGGPVWELTGRASGVRLATGGVLGLHFPEDVDWVQESPAVDGQTWNGGRTPARKVFWPVRVFRDGSSMDWIRHDSAWWDSLDPAVPGWWTVFAPDGSWRRLRCRHSPRGDWAFDLDPAPVGWARYGVALTADWPYWQGPEVVREFQPPNDQSFFGSTGVIRISPGNTWATAAIDNPGKVPAYLRHSVTGPATAATIRGNVLPAITAGKGLVLNTAPIGLGAQSALDADVAVVDGQRVFTLTGTDRTAELGAVNFAPLAPGEEVPVAVSVTGSGYVRVALTPDYYRAW